MKARFQRPNRAPGGFAYVLAVVLLSLFASVAVALVATTGGGTRQAQNARRVLTAQLAAESGLEFMLAALRDLTLPADMTEASLLDDLTSGLSAHLEGTGNLNGASLSLAGGVLTVPWITYGEAAFQCRFHQDGEGACWLVVTGRDDSVQRSVAMELKQSPAPGGIFDYGIASRGRIGIWGSSCVRGLNEPGEAHVFSSLDDEEAIKLRGNVTIEGELFLSGDGATADVQGNSATVGGVSGRDAILETCVHEVPDPEFPKPDPAGFRDLAVNDLPPGNQHNGATYTNIRIPAGRNPQFGNDVVLNGIVYIEAPNQVTFKSDCTINGFVVTEDGSPFDFDECQITFKSKVTSPGVDALPDTPEFAAIRQYEGSFVLAPGFGVQFHGQVNAINGYIAADKIDLWGHVDLTVTGFVLGLTEREMTLHGHNTLTINSDTSGRTWGGLDLAQQLSPNPNTYVEQTGGP